MNHTTHVVPTHLRTPETVLSWYGISLTASQLLWSLIGSTLSYDCWLHLGWLASLPAGMLVRLLLTLLPGISCLVLAFVKVARRSLPIWLLVICSYSLRPHRFVWHSTRWFEPMETLPILVEEAV